MNKIITILLLAACSSFTNWHYNLDEARQIAHKEHKYILLNFSGSDWCGPCICMHKEIFESQSFSHFAESSLIMVNADFPRNKNNQLPAKQQDLNNAMADSYNDKGIFPYTVLLNDQGKALRSWEGFPNTGTDKFIADIQTALDADK